MAESMGGGRISIDGLHGCRWMFNLNNATIWGKNEDEKLSFSRCDGLHMQGKRETSGRRDFFSLLAAKKALQHNSAFTQSFIH